MREKEKTRVIWRHPQGRFEIQETEHYSLFDHCTYYTREWACLLDTFSQAAVFPHPSRAAATDPPA